MNEQEEKELNNYWERRNEEQSTIAGYIEDKEYEIRQSK